MPDDAVPVYDNAIDALADVLAAEVDDEGEFRALVRAPEAEDGRSLLLSYRADGRRLLRCLEARGWTVSPKGRA